MNNDTITKDMLVGTIVAKHPEVIDTLMSLGMHCFGCPSSHMETLYDACLVHGLAPDEVVVKVNATTNL